MNFEIDPSEDNSYSLVALCKSKEDNTELIESILSYENINPSTRNNRPIKHALINNNHKLVNLLFYDHRFKILDSSYDILKLCLNDKNNSLFEIILNDERMKLTSYDILDLIIELIVLSPINKLDLFNSLLSDERLDEIYFKREKYMFEIILKDPRIVSRNIKSINEKFYDILYRNNRMKVRPWLIPEKYRI